MEFVCNDCGEFFERPMVLKDMGGDKGEDLTVCPFCHSTEWEEAVECAICGHEVRESFTKECVCEDCLNEFAGIEHAKLMGDKNKEFVQINSLYASVFQDYEIENILKEQMIKRFFPEEITKISRDFCLKDEWVFAEYLKEEGVYR